MAHPSRASVIALAASAWFILPASAQSSSQQICDLAAKRGGLTSLTVEGVDVGNGNRRIEGVRVGEAKTNGELLWFCPGSGSIIPADACTLTLTLASGESYLLNEQRLHVVSHQGTFYAVAQWRKSEKAVAHTDIYRVERNGFRKVCSTVERSNFSSSRREEA